MSLQFERMAVKKWAEKNKYGLTEYALYRFGFNYNSHISNVLALKYTSFSVSEIYKIWNELGNCSMIKLEMRLKKMIGAKSKKILT